MGKSGAGKSSFARLLMGIIKPECGTFELCNKDVRIGMAFQFPENQFYLNTILDDVAKGIIDSGTTEKDAHIRAAQALKRVNLTPEEYEQRNHLQLSVGEKRRAAIAMLLCLDSDIYLFDEPTAGLDGYEIKNLADIINTLKQEGKTIIIVSQNSSFISETCERLVLLNNGNIEYDGEIAAFFFDDELINSSGMELPPTVRTLIKLNEQMDIDVKKYVKFEDLKNMLGKSKNAKVSNSIL